MRSRSATSVVVEKIGRVLAEYGFDAAGRQFRLHSPRGDWVVVDVQTSDVSTHSRPLFFINAGYTMGPRWDWDRSVAVRARDAPAVEDCLWRTRIDPRNGDRANRWVVESDAALPDVLEEVAHVLRQEVPSLVRLLDRGHLRDLSDREAGLGYATWQIKAWLLAEDGKASELETILKSLEEYDEEDSLFQAMRRLAASREGRPPSGEE